MTEHIVAAGSGNFVAELYNEHQGWLKRWLRSKLSCADTASDLMQDTFVRILQNRNKPTEDTLREPRAYLRVIANGLLIDHFRRRSLEQAYLEALAAMPETLGISQEERLLILEALHRIDAMLDRLPARVRTVFLLSQLEGLTYNDIAERLGISLRTVKRCMQQGFAECLTLML